MSHSFMISGGAGNPPADLNTIAGTVDVIFTEEFTKTAGATGTDPFETISRDFLITSDESVRLIFEHVGASDNGGIFLDNVRLERVPSP